MDNSYRGFSRKWMCRLVVQTGLALAAVLQAGAATYYVATNGNDAAAGTNWATAVLTISNAVAKTASGADVVLVSNGTYFITNFIVFRAFNPGMTIRSLNGASNTIVDAQGTNRCFYMGRGTLDGFTLTNGFENSGSAHQSGGAIAIAGYDGVRILNCIITDCVATHYGGGIGVRDWSGGNGADVIISNCTFLNNTALYGGAIDLYCNRAHVYDCVFENNHATSSGDNGGGAISALGSYTNTIAGCTFRNNTAGNRGGAVRLRYGHPETTIVSNCTFEGNSGLVYGGGLMVGDATVVGCMFASNIISAGYGGGLYAGGTNALVSNCRFVGNLAHRNGGGMYNYGLVIGSLFAGNTATNLGGGVYNAGGTVANCTIVDNAAITNTGGGIYLESGGVENTIVYFNTAAVADGSNWTHAAGYFTNICTAPSVAAYGAGNITDDPLFMDAAAGNYRLQSHSPGINAGLNQDWMFTAVDLDGFPRVRQRIVDMGAFEGLRGGTFITVR